MQPKRWRGALIGCGFFGRIQAEAWRRIPEAELVAACDPILERARALAPRAYASAEELLDREELDFVDIATRPETHLELVRAAAARGLAVLCQKPLAPTWREAVALVQGAEAAGVRLMVHENWRWQPWFRVARRSLDAGEIGAPLAYQFRVRRDDGRGPEPYPAQPYFRHMPRLLVFETLVHHLDVARYFFGNLEAVFARLRRINPVIAGEDRALLVVIHGSGLEGSIDGHRFLDAAPDSPLMGDAVIEGDGGRLYVSPEGHVFRNGRCVWENRIREGYRGDSARAAQQHFLACLASGAAFESEGRSYLETFAAVEAAYRSAAEARLVRLEEILR